MPPTAIPLIIDLSMCIPFRIAIFIVATTNLSPSAPSRQQEG